MAIIDRFEIGSTEYEFQDQKSHNLAAQYSTSATYAVGDYCIKDGDLYKCTTAITTAEAWTAAHWAAAKIAPNLASQSEKIDALEESTETLDGKVENLEKESVYFYKEQTVSDQACLLYFDGTLDIGIRPQLVYRLKAHIIHPSGKTSSSANGVGYIIAVRLKTGSNKNLVVDGNVFPQSHAQPHKMDLVYDLVALNYKIIGTIDYYCDDEFVMRKDINIDEPLGIDYFYAIGGYFNTGNAQITYQTFGQLETTKTNQID